MRMMGRIFAVIFFLFACGNFAMADPLDFKTNILDPPATGFTTYPVTGSGFTFQFTSCGTDELPDGLTADGCFAGVNRSGSDWSAMGLALTGNAATAGQPASCDTEPGGAAQIFGSNNCANGYDPTTDTYDLDFSGGTITNGELFFITEDGIDPVLFPMVTISVTTVTPEPPAAMLLGTGLLCAVCFGWASRRRLSL